jgi:hypothetical protein
MATYTFTSLMTPGGSSSPFLRRSILAAYRAWISSIFARIWSVMRQTSSSTDRSSTPIRSYSSIESA